MRTIPATPSDPEVPWHQLRSPRVYLAGPRTCLDPSAYAALAAALVDLGLIRQAVAPAFETAARELRALGADVTTAAEQPWWLGAEVDADELRAGRAVDASAPAAADVVVVLDGWLDVPGAVDAAALGARTAGVPVVVVGEAMRALRARAGRHRRPAA